MLVVKLYDSCQQIWGYPCEAFLPPYVSDIGIVDLSSFCKE